MLGFMRKMSFAELPDLPSCVRVPRRLTVGQGNILINDLSSNYHMLAWPAQEGHADCDVTI